MTDPNVRVSGGRTDERLGAHTYMRPTVRPFVSLGNGARKRHIPPCD